MRFRTLRDGDAYWMERRNAVDIVGIHELEMHRFSFGSIVQLRIVRGERLEKSAKMNESAMQCGVAEMSGRRSVYSVGREQGSREEGTSRMSQTK